MFARDQSDPGITALLGPTNTGKTHRAIERLLEHPTGMMGLPLRLLAREVYDRITGRIGERSVALVTGEEKRIPRKPQYWICTVEAMPMSEEVDFLVVDEIQLCANRERGHVFTDRLLHARGRVETWFLGSETARALIERLVPTARIRSHPRLSKLRSQPPTGIGGLPKRSAVVAFSSQRVYEIAERIRNKHGGAALVLGALSPRTRNAQVALYQSGEVDYLVATDAIGMGLNLSIRHVAFADVTKFDGRESRPLELAELAQIAGRAGRYLDDGTFGVLTPRAPLAHLTVRALEHHQFPAEAQLYWRNSQLDFSNIDALVASLRDAPPRRELRAIEPAADHRALVALGSKPSVRCIATSADRVALLWEICQIPDYPQLLFEIHVKLLEEIFLQLTGPRLLLDPSWIDDHLRRIDRIDGDIETLMGHIAEIRTWNYISQHASWVDNAGALAGRARSIEDRLSDALHERLVARFVEKRRTFALPPASTTVSAGSLQKPHPFAQLISMHASSLPAYVDPLLEQASWTDRLVDAPHERFRADLKGRLYFEDRRVGTLLAGGDLLHPDVQVRLEPDPGRGACTRVQRRLLAFSRDLVAQLLGPTRAPAVDPLSGAARGLLYQLERGLGSVRVLDCQSQLAELAPRDRQVLASQGLRFGRKFLYYRRLLDADAIALRIALTARHFTWPFEEAQKLLSNPAIPAPNAAPAALVTAIGFTRVGPLLLRIDQFERLAAELANCERHGSFNAPRDLSARFHCDAECIPYVLLALGFARQANGRWASSRHSPQRQRSTSERRDSPRRSPIGRPTATRSHSPVDSNSEA